MEWIVARWVTFVATLMITGVCAVGLAMVPRIRGDDQTRDSIAADAARLGIGAVLALIPASCLRLGDQVMALRSPGDPVMAGMHVLLTSTTWGTGFLWQCAATLLAGAGFVLAARDSRAPAAWTLATLGAIGLCVTPSLQGHAIGSEDRTAIAVGVDIAHVVGASIWLGMLSVIGYLGVLLPNGDGVITPDRSSRADARLRVLIPLVPPLALPGAALLIGSGVIATVLKLQDVSDLWHADWGFFILAKALLVGVIVVLGAINWRRLGPMLTTPADLRVMRKSLVTELLLALLVLMITAILVVTPLPGE